MAISFKIWIQVILQEIGDVNLLLLISLHLVGAELRLDTYSIEWGETQKVILNPDIGRPSSAILRNVVLAAIVHHGKVLDGYPQLLFIILEIRLLSVIVILLITVVLLHGFLELLIGLNILGIPT